MKFDTSKVLLAASSVAVLLALAGCGERQDGETVGQRVDQAISKTTEAGREVKQGAEKAAEDAKNATRTAADKTREATADARTSVMGAGREGGASVGQKIDDAGITAKINTALSTDKDLSATKIDVDTRDGAVTLMGTAPSAAAKARAGELAKNVKDVKSVNNQLVVKG